MDSGMIEDLERAAKEATPGERTISKTLVGGSDINRRSIYAVPGIIHICDMNYHMGEWTKEHEANAQYLVSSGPDVVLQLIADLRAWKELAEKQHEALNTIYNTNAPTTGKIAHECVRAYNEMIERVK